VLYIILLPMNLGVHHQVLSDSMTEHESAPHVILEYTHYCRLSGLCLQAVAFAGSLYRAAGYGPLAILPGMKHPQLPGSTKKKEHQNKGIFS
jgi:hypothetical protein